MFAGHDTVILEWLRAREPTDAAQLDRVAAESRAIGRPLAALALERGLIGRAGLLNLIAEQLGCACAEPVPPIAAATLAALPASLARLYGVVPLRADSPALELLALYPFDGRIAEDLAFILGRQVRLVVADPDQVAELLRRHYGGTEAEPGGLFGEIGASTAAGMASSETELDQLAEQAPLIRFVNYVLARAIREHASDLHFEPFEHEFKIRCRIDGVLREWPPPPRRLARPILSRLKVLANLNIAERRLPQDGRIALTLAGRPVDLRVSTLPTQFGESVVLRVLDQAAGRLDFDQLGLPTTVATGLRVALRRPNGLLVVTGPTGSGKTTTLYGALGLLNAAERKLLTIEDPVEYEIDGVMQAPVNVAAGFTFPNALRAFLRQDPDVILVGEIRDGETAQMAVQAALTGHLVLATLHTVDAAGVIARLADLGVEPFLLSATLIGVLAQRLLRRICAECRAPLAPSVAQRDWLAATAPEATGPFFAGRGCATCGGTGYRGRVGLFEWLEVGEPIRELIAQRAPESQLRREATAAGLRSLRAAALEALSDGHTTLEDVLQFT